jgi:hypothetical protein
MDTFREYLELNRLWQAGKAPWRVWEDGNGFGNGHTPSAPPGFLQAQHIPWSAE